MGLWFVLLSFALIGGIVYLLTLRSSPIHPYSTSGNSEIASSTGEVMYEVPKNVSLTRLARDLESKGLIPNSQVFKWFLRLSRQDKKIKAGFYYVPRSNSALNMAYLLTKGKPATKTVTIPEGKTSWEVYSLLKSHFEMDSLRFDSLVHNPEFAILCRIPAANLEGYLFPDTYRLPWRISEKDILKLMTARFLKVFGELDTHSTVYSTYGKHGWVTLASIVEKEAAVKGEQQLIAGVFFNRLQKGWSLGADPTVRFIIKKMTGPLYQSELDVNSPYNTRKFNGIPPGPICSPGRGALSAALNPMKTEKMFFVAKDDGSREHYFSTDNVEHMRFKDKAARNRIKSAKEGGIAAKPRMP